MKKNLLFLFASAFAVTASAQNILQQKIDSLAAAYLQNVPGALAIGIVDNGKEKIYYYGETVRGSKVHPDRNSIFELGELSETLTCILYADMTLKGIIRGDDKLQNFLPVNIAAPVYQKIICRRSDDTGHNQLNPREPGTIYFTPYVCIPDPSSKPQEIILCDLATHTTGLPAYPANFKFKKNSENPFANYSKDNLYDFVKKFHFENPIGYDYKHSATGIALLGHALTLKAKRDFDTLITERLFDPLKMIDTKVNLSEEQQGRLLQGYNSKGDASSHWTYNIMAPAGGLHSTISDMTKFLSVNIAIQKDYYSDLLDYTHNSRIELTGKKDKDKAIALGWKINPLVNEKRVVWQSGMTGGFALYIGFVETSHTGVVILSSVAKDTQQTAEQILKLLEIIKL